MTQEQLLKWITLTKFACVDANLYLDTHPQDMQALDLLKSMLAQRKQLLKEFAQRFFPLTMDCMEELYQAGTGEDCYCWQEGPMPWEGACV